MTNMTNSTNKPRVLVLGGGPDAERDVSIASASAIHQGCLDAGFDAQLKIVDRPDLDQVRSWDTDVVFPALHGRYGEGGALQSLLQQSSIKFVGSEAASARLAMDKLGTKLIAARLGIPTPAACVLDPNDAFNPAEAVCPLEFPVVIKPVSEGSSVGLHICQTRQDWLDALPSIASDLQETPNRIYMIERMAQGREITVSVLEDEREELWALPLIEIAPSEGVYDYQAKYQRNDTVYTTNPKIPEGIAAGIAEHALRVCIASGIKHLARVDFILSNEGEWSMLEVNTMPGFTATSLLPMAAKAAGMDLPTLCKHLIECAINDHLVSTTATTADATTSDI